MRKTLIALVILCTTFHGIAQINSYKEKNDYVSVFKVNGAIKSVRSNANKPVTALSIQYFGDLQDAYFLIDGERLPISEDEHYIANKKSSNLVILKKPATSIQLELNDSDLNDLEIHAIHAPARQETDIIIYQDTTEYCIEPESIDQSIWRAGLPAPSYSRVFTETRNIIVHHSAGSNSLTDYENVVRNIYLFHTQDRGWSDIGYNYLIAQDGSIFKGRDPGNGEQDIVRGAHFCGQNTNTMGICLLGNLSLVEPTKEALTSLTQLVNWKTLKDDLDPLGTRSHPANSSLRVIAGHRDGCATECPGNFMYPHLSDVREDVDREHTDCLTPPEEPTVTEVKLGPNPTDSELNIFIPDDTELTSVGLQDLRGQSIAFEMSEIEENHYRIQFTNAPPGIYLLTMDGPNPSVTKIILQN